MGKHERPYKCNVKGCRNLRGFTSSDGLIRHESEVHKMHSESKMLLFCPYPDCKRSSGTGFTRKENLAEHIRRMHQRTSKSADTHGVIDLNDKKRKCGSSEFGGDKMREEIKHLRQDIEDHDSRLRRLERTVLALQSELKSDSSSVIDGKVSYVAADV
jgi:hypothetical protein